MNAIQDISMSKLYQPRTSNEYTIRVGIAAPHEPYVMPCSMENFTVREDCLMPGIAVEVLDYVLKKADIPYVTVPINISAVYGAVRGDNVWSGYLGAIQQGIVDTVAAEFTPTSSRLSVFAFTAPFAIEDVMGVAPKAQEAPRFLKLAALLFGMFDFSLWSLILGTAVLCVFLLLGAYAILNGVTYTNAAELLRRNAPANVVGVSVRALLMIVGLCFVLLFNMYQGLLLSSLLRGNKEKPFDTMHGAADAIARKTLKHVTYTLDNSFIQTVLNDKDLAFYRKALAQNPIQIVANDYEVFKIVSDGFGFTYGGEFAMIYNSQKFCNIRPFKLPMFGSTITSFPFRYDYNATQRKLIDTVIKHDFASLVRIQLRYRSVLPPREKCHVQHNHTTSKGENAVNSIEEQQPQKLPVAALNFYNMVGLWAITALGFLFSAIALLFEILYAFRRHYETQ